MDLEQELNIALRAIRDGADSAAVEARFQQKAGMSLSEAAQRVHGPRIEAERRAREFGPGGALRMAFQGLTAEFGDELIGLGAGLVPGGQTRAEATEASRAEVQRLREASPLGALAAEGLGAGALFAIPGAGPVAGAFRAGRLGSAAARATAAGAAEGGLFGLGAGETPGERVVGAALGAGTGGLFGAGGALAASGIRTLRRPGRDTGRRLIAGLEEQTGLQRSIKQAIRKADEELEAVRRDFYAPLERDFPVIDNVRVMAAFEDPLVRPHARKVSADLVGPEARPPSLREAQEIMQRLRGVKTRATNQGNVNLIQDASESLDVLRGALEDAVPGLADANRRYARVAEVGRSLEVGRKFWNKGADDIEMAVESLQSVDAVRAFNEGRLHEITRRLGSNRMAPSMLKRFIDEGPEAQAVLRSIFPDDRAYNEFVDLARRETNAESIRNALTRLGRIATLGIGFGGRIGRR